jgi:peptidoglycan/xylan/chitin deacetylase (PgdA/CDA1 family)
MEESRTKIASVERGLATMKNLFLLFHDVVPDGRFELSGFQSSDANLYKLDSNEFQQHLAVVKARAPKPPGLVFDQNAEETQKVLLTFDDGGASSATLIADMLAASGCVGHFLMTTDFIGTPGFVSEAEIRDLHAKGHVIGSHSCSHPARMSSCSPMQLDREWRESVARLQDILGSDVQVASIPGGYYGVNVAAAAAAAGIRHLFTSEPVTSVWNVDGCQVYGRFSVHRGVKPQWVASLLEDRVLPRVQTFAYWNLKKLLKKAGGSAWLEARRKIVAARTPKT